MPAPHDTSLARIRVSTTLGGTYADVGFVRSSTWTEGSEGTTTLRWLGGEATRAGDNTLSVSITAWFDAEADANGQAILKAAKRSGTNVFLQSCPLGTATGAKCDQGEVTIDEFAVEYDADGEAVGVTFSATGTTATTVTLA